MTYTEGASSAERRLRILRATGLLDAPARPGFDRLTRLAAALLHTPVALVSLVEEHRQFFHSAVGLAEPWAGRRETPLSHSFCQYAVRDRAPLIVDDAREHALLRDNLAIRDLGVIAYAGIPLIVQGEAIGVFCVADTKPRAWSVAEVQLLSDLTESVIAEVELGLALRAAEQREALTDAVLESLGDGVLAVDQNRTFVLANAAARGWFAEGAERGKDLPLDWSSLHRSRLADGSALPADSGALPRALRGETTDALEFSLERADGKEVRWVEATGRPVRDVDGAVIAGVAVYRDVTDRKHRTDLYRALAANIPHAAVVLFDRELRCVAIDGGLLREDGVDPKGLVGKTMRSLAGRTAEDRDFDGVDDMYRRTLEGEALARDFVDAGRTLALNTAPVRDAFSRVTAGIVLATNVTEQRKTAKALREQDQAYLDVARNLPRGAVFTLDRELRYLSADGPALPQLFRGESIIGRRVEEVASPENRENVLKFYRAALAGNTGRLELERGKTWYEVTAVPRVDGESGAIVGVLVVCYDISERRHAHEVVDRERALFAGFRDFIEHMSGGVIIVRGADIAYANPALVQMLGYSDPSELLGRPAICTLVHPDDREYATSRVDAAHRDAILARTLRCLRRDGSVIVVESSPRPFHFEGMPAVISVLRDLTADLRVEQTRRQVMASLEAFRLTVESIHDHAIFELDPDGNVRTWNAGAKAIKGYEAEEILGRSFTVFYPPEKRAAAERGLAKAALGNHVDEGWRVRKDGSVFWASVVVTALRDPDGALSGFVKVTRDLTERKREEDRQELALAEKTAMLQEIHHRVKNNLQMISSLLSLQARQIGDPGARAMFADTQGRVRSIALLHESLYQSADLGRVDMQAYVTTLVTTVQRAYGDDAASFVVSIENIHLPVNLAIPCGLIVNELITNSLKHAFRGREGLRQISVEIGRLGAEVTVTVSDNGTGYPVLAGVACKECMGLTLVRDLSAQLRGSVELASVGGARCTVSFGTRGDPVP